MSAPSVEAVPPFVMHARDCYPANARAAVRHVALDVLSSFNTFEPTSQQTWTRPRIQFFCLHHLFRDERPGFEAMLAWLTSHFTFISYSAAVQRIRYNRIDKPYAVISFDDGFRSCMSAAEILNQYHISACFFLATAYIGTNKPATTARICAERFHTKAQPFMSWSDVEQLCTWGHEIGSHTHTHAYLAGLDDEAVAEEVHLSNRVLQGRVGDVKHFAWPFGKFGHITRRAAAILRASPYQSIASAERGCHINGGNDPSSLCLRRDIVFPRWPLRHLKYFLLRNSRRVSIRGNVWPSASSQYAKSRRRR